MYSWTTYPITALQDWLYATELSRINSSNPAPPDPFFVEFTAITDRLYAFMHTGNAACLVRTVMDGLWVSRALLIDGLPSFNPRKFWIQVGGEKVSVQWNSGFWPIHPTSRAPLSAAKAGMLFHYGRDQFNVRLWFYWGYSFHNLLWPLMRSFYNFPTM
jgi:hypothetical protein